MLKNAYLLAKIGADPAENEQHFADNLPKIGNYPTGAIAASSFQRRVLRRPADGAGRARARGEEQRGGRARAPERPAPRRRVDGRRLS